MNQPQSQDRITVQPILRSPAEARPRAADSAEEGRSRRLLLVFGFVVLGLLAIGVFVFLPTLVEQSVPPAPRQASAPAAIEPKPQTPAAEVDYLRLAREMDAAEQARGAYEALFASYDQRGAAQWAGDPFTKARSSGKQALQQFEARQFVAAEQTYKQALSDLHHVSEIADTLLKQQLEEGAQALAQGRSTAARQAFEFALRVDPENAQAMRGAKRAETLDAAYASLTAGAEAERAGSLKAAAERYRETLKIDPQMAPASEGLSRVEAAISADSFAQAMSAAVGALAAGRPAEARNAFERAARIRPGAPEIKDGLARAAELERHNAILKHRKQAQELEENEQWDKALVEYETALRLDPALDFAKSGLARVQPRAAMNKQFEELTGQPERLLTPAVRQQARALLAEAEKISAGPVLRKQTEELAALLARAETPVAVALQSDNQTDVAINRVTRLGAFARRKLNLLPGRYVVVGTRQGYRDVRKELTVLPGESPSLTVQCEEPI